MTAGDARLAAALGKHRERAEEAATFGWSGPSTEALPLLAAIDRALELTNPLTNPTLGGTFLAAVGVQVREAILAELTGRPPGLPGPGEEER